METEIISRLIGRYVACNAKSISLCALCFFGAMLVSTVDRTHFVLGTVLRAIPIFALLGLLLTFLFFWVIWLVNVYLSARLAKQSFRDFVMGPEYLELLNQDGSEDE